MSLDDDLARLRRKESEEFRTHDFVSAFRLSLSLNRLRSVEVGERRNPPALPSLIRSAAGFLIALTFLGLCIVAGPKRNVIADAASAPPGSVTYKPFSKCIETRELTQILTAFRKGRT